MSTSLATLLNAVTAIGAGSSLDLSIDERYQGGMHSFEVSGTFVGTVRIEGSLDGGSTWHDLGGFTDTGGLVNIGGVYTQLRGNVTGYTSGNITLQLRYGRLQDLKTDLDTLLARLTATRAGLLDDLVLLDISVYFTAEQAKTNNINLIKQLRRQGGEL